VTSIRHVHRIRRRGSVEVDGAGPVVAHVGHPLVEHGVEPGASWVEHKLFAPVSR
jgi:hypothetical protein